jgi:Zn-dependent peptidase ImmA (M78 family)
VHEVKTPRIPARVKIKNKVTYEVVWVDSFVDKPDEKTYGECRYDQKQNALLINQSERQAFKSFSHEVAHAVCHERGIKISHQAIHQLEDAIYYILFHNTWESE